MKSDWTLIRETMNAAIDACERIEALNLSENELAASGVDQASVWEFLQSAWIYPENASYVVIRARHQLGEDKPFTPELARVLLGVARFCSELIGAEKLDATVSKTNPHASNSEESIRELAQQLQRWYKEYFVSGVTSALSSKSK